ncbi:response regulator transcription factor [Catenovulum sediminis]|uniref:Response regulator transcription factor n=1 Tax=Catenovulum sediminis TaxID=1740262 RepID=A0ABV1RJ43_9ALTE|nr:response regulator transcription factor [Catenovulum sediminis]
MSNRVLLIEDDQNLAATVMHFLELNQIDCDHCGNGVQGVNLVNQNSYDVVVTDVNMPLMSGTQMCSTLRSEGKEIPILMVSALSDIDDKLTGFDSGADDYLVKPFELRELLARIKVLSHRRSGQVKALKIAELGLELDLSSKTARRDGHILRLTPSGWSILESLARAYPKAVSKQDLEYAIWGDDLPDSSVLKVHIHRLRQSLDKDFGKPLLHIVHGFGFELRNPLND